MSLVVNFHIFLPQVSPRPSFMEGICTLEMLITCMRISEGSCQGYKYSISLLLALSAGLSTSRRSIKKWKCASLLAALLGIGSKTVEEETLFQICIACEKPNIHKEDGRKLQKELCMLVLHLARLNLRTLSWCHPR